MRSSSLSAAVALTTIIPGFVGLGLIHCSEARARAPLPSKGCFPCAVDGARVAAIDFVGCSITAHLMVMIHGATEDK